MKVYIEYVLIDNFIIDYLLLKATFVLTKVCVKRKRLFFASFLGAVFALILPIIESVTVIAILYKISTGLLIVLIANKHYTFRAYYVCVLTFFAMTFLTGGAIIGVFSLLGISYNNEICIAIMVVPAYLIIKEIVKITEYFYRKKSTINYVYKVGIFADEKEIIVNGYLDSGNTVYHLGFPVVFIVKSLAKKLINKNVLTCKLKKIEINTVTGKSQKIAFNLEKLKIYKGDEQNIINNVTACIVSDDAFNGYELILHPSLMEVCDEKLFNDKAKKVS